MNYIEKETVKISKIIEKAQKEQKVLSEEENQIILKSLSAISKQEKEIVHNFNYDEQCLMNFESIVDSICTLLRASVDNNLLAEVSEKMKLLAEEVKILSK